MELEQVKGNTWVLKSWELIPVYRLDSRRCVLLDSGLASQREELLEALDTYGLDPVGVICSHAHIDHMGNLAHLQKTRGTQIALSLAEAGHLSSYLGQNEVSYCLSMDDVRTSPEVAGTPCLADRIILPQEREIDFCGARFSILPTPGHTAGHICVGTPDNVLYLGDAMMTGRTLHHSKFPYAFSVGVYLDSMRKLRSVPADKYIVAHFGVYDEILPLVDMEARFLAQRMVDLLDLVEDYTTPKLLTAAICETYRVRPQTLRDLAYFEEASQTYLHYLREQGYLEADMSQNRIRYRKTRKALDRANQQTGGDLPPTGQFR